LLKASVGAEIFDEEPHPVSTKDANSTDNDVRIFLRTTTRPISSLSARPKSGIMLSKSRSAAGESRYSDIRAAELALECARVEALRLPALFPLDQRRANRLYLCAALLPKVAKVSLLLCTNCDQIITSVLSRDTTRRTTRLDLCAAVPQSPANCHSSATVTH